MAMAFEPAVRILNQLLQAVGITGPGWLASPTWSKPGLIIMGIWASIGTQMIIYLAALQGVPKELLEAAQVDGASKWRVFWRITIPMISPAIFFNFVIGVIFSFQVFTPAFIMTSGGPLQSTTFWVFYIFQQAFAFFNLGYAAALSFLLLIFVLILHCWSSGTSGASYTTSARRAWRGTVNEMVSTIGSTQPTGVKQNFEAANGATGRRERGRRLGSRRASLRREKRR